jgi:CheY-like chemotaxis protein
VNNNPVAQQWSSGSRLVRVLMADPDKSLPPVFRGPLLHEGFELLPTTNGLECIARMKEHAPEVLILEPQLPWGGGEGVLAVMGEIPWLATVPVMVLTSCRDPHLLEAVSGFPVSDYQVKPLAPDRLAGRLRSMLAHPKLRFTLAEQTGRLKCSIARRTGDRIQGLRVEIVDGRVIVRGRSDSHHVKQLALAAVMEAFEASQTQSERIDLDIEVAPIDGWQARRCELSESPESSETTDETCSNELALSKEN